MKRTIRFILRRVPFVAALFVLFALYLYVTPFDQMKHARLYAQGVFELACPAGTTSFQEFQTFNPATGKNKQNLCIDATGAMIFQGTSGITQVTANPTCPASGAFLYFNTVTNQLLQCNNGVLSTATGGWGTVVDAKQFGVQANGHFSCTAGTTNGQPTVTDIASDYIFSTPDVGSNIFITNLNCSAFTLNSVYILPNPSTILSVQSAHSITVSNNASATCANVCTLFIWKNDDQAALNAAWAAATAIPVCGTVLLPMGYIPVSAPIQSAGKCGQSALIEPGTSTAAAIGVGMNASVLVPLPTFNATNCTSANGGCFFGISGTNVFSGVQFQNFTINGMGQATVTGANSGNAALFCGEQCFMNNIAMYFWAGNAGGFYGAQTGATPNSPANLTNVANFDFGNIGFNFTGGGVLVNVQNLGTAATIGTNANIISYGSFWECGTVSVSCLQSGAGSNVRSIGDTFQTLGATTNGVIAQGGSAVMNLVSPLFICNASSTAMKVNASNTLHVTQAQFSGCGSATAVNNAGNFFDDGGNGFAGTITNTGAWFGDGSVSGTALAAANITPTSGFGTGCTTAGQCVSVVTGGSRLGQFTMTYGAAPASPQVLTIAFPTPFLVTPICTLVDVGGTNAFPTSIVTTTCTTSGASFTITNTPVGGNTEVLQASARVP